MAFVDDDKVVVAPVDVLKVESAALSGLTRKVGMIKDVVAQSVGNQRIVDVVAAVSNPVVVQLLRAKHEHRLVAVLIVFYDRKGRERLAETHGIGKYAAVVFLKVVDDIESRVALEIIDFSPDDAILEAGGLVGENVLRNIFKELVEDIV